MIGRVKVCAIDCGEETKEKTRQNWQDPIKFYMRRTSVSLSPI